MSQAGPAASSPLSPSYTRLKRSAFLQSGQSAEHRTDSISLLQHLLFKILTLVWVYTARQLFSFAFVLQVKLAQWFTFLNNRTLKVRAKKVYFLLSIEKQYKKRSSHRRHLKTKAAFCWSTQNIFVTSWTQCEICVGNSQSFWFLLKLLDFEALQYLDI